MDVPLYSAELLIALLGELGLHTNHGFEAGVKVGDAEVEEHRELVDELIVEHLVHFFSVVLLLLCLYANR